MKPIYLALALTLTGLSGPACNAYEPESDGNVVQSELVAVEFSGSARSLNRLAAAATRLGWRVDTHTERALRLLPPVNYNPDQFGLLLASVEELGLNDIGLRLIGPNGPVGPEG